MSRFRAAFDREVNGERDNESKPIKEDGKAGWGHGDEGEGVDEKLKGKKDR